MATTIDLINRVFREFKRFTGDGLPGEPVNAPLPVGDPQSGINNPKKHELREAFIATVQSGADAAYAVAKVDEFADGLASAQEDAANALALAGAGGSKAPVSVRTVIDGGVSIANGLESGDTPAGSGLSSPLVTGDLVVVAGHGTPSLNGVWEVQASGTALRGPGYETGEGLYRASFYAMDGNTAGQVWAVRNDEPPMVDTDAIAISQAYEFAGVEVADSDEALVGASHKLMSAQRSAQITIDLSRSTDLDVNWTGTGPVEPLAVAVEGDMGRVLLGIERATGKVVGHFGDSGGGGGDHRAAQHSEALGYVDNGVLRAIGGAAGDRVLDDNPEREWIFAQAELGNVLGVYADSASDRHLVRVAPSSGDLFWAGEWSVITEDGQSNGEGQAGSGAQALVASARYEHLRMLGTAIWTLPNQATSGGNSLPLNGAAVTEFSALRDSVASSGTHASTALAGMLRAQMAAAEHESDWLPDLVGWNNAEGGQAMASLLPSAPEGRYAFANAIIRLQRAQALKPEGVRLVYRWMLMMQGEGNSGTATLGELHEAYRAAMEVQAHLILGQSDPLRMMTWQPSSFYATTTGARSLLDYHLAHAQTFGTYWCAGPTYIYPWTSDYLHNSSLGHLMRGEFARQIINAVEKTGAWHPLHMVSAEVSGEYQITVTLSEPAMIDLNWLVAPNDHAGITIPGRTVAHVSVSGTTMTILVAEAAAGATTVEAALAGHAGSRNAATIPRSTVRSIASMGRWSADCGIHEGTNMHKPLCHQSIAIS